MLATLGLIAAIGFGTKPLPIDHLRLYRSLNVTERARVSVWMNRTDPYARGDRARVYVSTEQDAFLTVLRIDTDGRVRVLFPQDPWDDNWVPGGRTFEVEDRDGGRAFRVDDPPGAGYVFAIASEDRFNYEAILTERDHWDYRNIADGQVRGDPYVAITDLAERIVTPEADYDYDLAQYDVERHYEYPRFVCYDCHAYAPYYSWNPYAHSCVRFRVVIYDDPYYYPYRYYGGRRVVVVRPRRPQPRYIFVDNDGRRDYVTRIQNRPRREEQNGGGGDDPIRPRRAEDVGGRGTIPAPGVEPRRRPAREGSTPKDQPGQPRRAEPRSGRPEPRIPPAETDQPERRREPQQPPAGLEPQRQPPREEPRREEPRREEPKREESTKREEPRREEPRREEPQRQEPRSEPRAEPRREEPRRQDPPSQRAEPRRESGGGSKPSSGPELRRRRG